MSDNWSKYLRAGRMGRKKDVGNSLSGQLGPARIGKFAYIRSYIGDRYKYNDKLFGLCLSINLLFYIGNILVANQGLEPRTCGL